MLARWIGGEGTNDRYSFHGCFGCNIFGVSHTLQRNKKKDICQPWAQFRVLADVQLTPQKPRTAPGDALSELRTD